ncbi:hypothetical protein FG05_13372 [Fusarium graminearum]|nr:hypothetical protein FG05_13372 [Fusarium graminearum]
MALWDSQSYSQILSSLLGVGVLHVILSTQATRPYHIRQVSISSRAVHGTPLIQKAKVFRYTPHVGVRLGQIVNHAELHSLANAELGACVSHDQDTTTSSASRLKL